MWKGIYRKQSIHAMWDDAATEIEAVHDDCEGFRIWVGHHDSTRGTLIATFDVPLLYLSSDEGDRISGLRQTDLKFPHVFWTVEDSELLGIFHRQSCGMHEQQDVKHFAFLSCNDCVDVLSIGRPQVRTNFPVQDRLA